MMESIGDSSLFETGDAVEKADQVREGKGHASDRTVHVHQCLRRKMVQAPWISKLARRLPAEVRSLRRYCCLAILPLLFLWVSEVEAAEDLIETLLLAPIPERATVEIRLPVEEGSDDLQLSIVLGAEFAILLDDLGYDVVDRGGELLFRFSPEEPTYAAYPAEPVVVLANIGNERISQSDPDTFRLRVGVSRERRPPLWAGFIQRSVRGAERRAAYLSMAQEVMRFWGETHSN